MIVSHESCCPNHGGFNSGSVVLALPTGGWGLPQPGLPPPRVRPVGGVRSQPTLQQNAYLGRCSRPPPAPLQCKLFTDLKYEQCSWTDTYWNGNEPIYMKESSCK